MLKVVERREGNAIHVLVENLESAEVTATFDLGLVNLRGSTTFPFTTTLSPHRTIEAFSLFPIDETREWHFSLTNAYTLGSSRAVHDDGFVYLLPYAAGQAFRVSQADDGAFSHSGPERHAIDWKMPEGTPVLAAREGIVVGTKDDSEAGGPDRSFENSANYILIQHPDGTIGNYAHLLKHGVKVSVGQTVETGTTIGLSGNTGFSSGPHLHFSVFKTRNGRERESIAIRFRTENRAAATLVSGKVYKASHTQLAAKKEQTGKGLE
jgi:murein DD-endopeptidase MepM/ murein hydrolase activator NlpD